MTNKTVFLTQEGLEKLETELQELKTVKRKEIAERIQEAKDLGDLSENAEYSDAKEEQGFIESRIMELEQMLKRVEVIATNASTGVVQIGSTVKAKDTLRTTWVFQIVGSSEADPSQHRISNESPLGKAFLNHSAGERVSVQAPGGNSEYTIVSIE